jgi:hypothetical protein
VAPLATNASEEHRIRFLHRGLGNEAGIEELLELVVEGIRMLLGVAALALEGNRTSHRRGTVNDGGMASGTRHGALGGQVAVVGGACHAVRCEGFIGEGGDRSPMAVLTP